MTFDKAKGSFKELKGQIKQKWAKLTDDDLGYVEGNVDELVGRIQKAYGEKKEEIRNKIDEMKARYSQDNEEFDEVEKSYKTVTDKDRVRSAKPGSGHEL